MRLGRNRWGGVVSGDEDVQESILDETEKSMALHYQIKVKGALDDDWSEWFDGLTITHGSVAAVWAQGETWAVPQDSRCNWYLQPELDCLG